MEWLLEPVRQNGKVNLCCHGNWHGCEEQTRINLFTLKEQQGRGVIWKETPNLINLDVLSVRGLITAVIWPCDLAVIPPHHLFSPVLHLRASFHHFTASEEWIKAEENVAEEWIVSMTTNSSPCRMSGPFLSSRSPLEHAAVLSKRVMKPQVSFHRCGKAIRINLHWIISVNVQITFLQSHHTNRNLHFYTMK